MFTHAKQGHFLRKLCNVLCKCGILESECQDKCGCQCVIKIKSLCLWRQAVCHLIRGYATLYLELPLTWIQILVITFPPSCLSVNVVECKEGTRNKALASDASSCRLRTVRGSCPTHVQTCGTRKVKSLPFVLPRRESLEIFQGEW